MADVKWIKVYTDMFDSSRKIKQIERMPQGDTIIIIWFKLLMLAGKINDGGAIYVTQSIPYDIEGLADELRREPSIVENALSVFEMFDMIERSNGFIYISSWEEYQNIEGLDKIREQNRLRKQKQREKKRASDGVSHDSHGTVTGQVTGSHATEREEEKEEEPEQESEHCKKKKGKKKKPEQPAKENTHALFDRIRSGYDLSDTLVAKIREWITYKIERKDDYTEQGLKSLLRRIENKYKEHRKNDEALCDLIDECMSNNWKGIIFERLKPPAESGNSSFDADEFFQAALAKSYGTKKGAVPPRTAMERQAAARMGENAQNPPKTAADDENIRERMEALKAKLG